MRAEAKRVGGISERLRAAREAIGLTQREMAERLGLALVTYGRSETGNRAMDEGELAALAGMGINLHWLVSGEGQMHWMAATERVRGVAEPAGKQA